MKQGKKFGRFTIVRGNADVHGGYHTGALNLSNLSALWIDEENNLEIDLGLLHAKSAIERGIRFTADQSQLVDGKRYWIIWLAIGQTQAGPCYAGIAVCSMLIDRERRIGWKNLAEHVNQMDKALKQRIDLAQLPAAAKQALQAFLQKHDQQMWFRSSEQFRQAFAKTNPSDA